MITKYFYKRLILNASFVEIKIIKLFVVDFFRIIYVEIQMNYFMEETKETL